MKKIMKYVKRNMWPLIGAGVIASSLLVVEPPDYKNHEPIPSEFLPGYTMSHGGISKSYGIEGNEARDFDGDGINDLYRICKDGTKIARLSSKNPTEIPEKYNPNYWYVVCKK